MKLFFDFLFSRNRAAQTDPMTSFALLLLRLWVGLFMALGHGWGKLTTFADLAAKFPDPFGLGSSLSLGLAVFAEFFCSLAIAAGFATRGALIPLIITMATAGLIIHGDDPFGKRELALLYLAPYVALLFTGPGRYSLDRVFSKK